MSDRPDVQVAPAPYKRAQLGNLQAGLSWLIVATLGALEGTYGRTQYVGDWISYLNVSRAVAALDWKNIFDPMWSPGYPALIALMRGIFPATADGEWRAINLLNWLIFLLGYGAWRYLIRRAIDFYKPSLRGLRDHPVVLWPACCAYLSCSLCLDRVSSVSPDLLVTTLFIFGAAQMLSLLNRPGVGGAVGLGLTLGAGYWVKGVFLPFAIIFLFTLLLACWYKKLRWRLLGISALVFAAMFVPYVAAISSSYGQLTLGVSGGLNYAFHVNHLPHWTNWQGGPTPFGAPLHPTRRLLEGLPIFEFGTPFRTTYPPYNNLAYWYRGARNFYSLKLQIVGTARAIYFLATTVRKNPFLCALALALCVVMLKREWRAAFLSLVISIWPLLLAAILGLSTYLLVHVEDRYLSPFFLIFSLFPLLVLLNPELRSKRVPVVFLMVLYTVGAVAELGVIDATAFRAAFHGEDFHGDPQWKMAAALPSYGLHSGDAIAIIDTQLPAYRCHWAYVSGLRIVAEFGSLPWSIAPWDRTRADHIRAEPADEDYASMFWNKLTPERRGQVIDSFRHAGAQAVLALSGPQANPEPGWQEITGTGAWIYRFGVEMAGSASSRKSRPVAIN